MGTVSILLLFFHLGGIDNATGDAISTFSISKNVTLGYCPTMEDHLELLEGNSLDFLRVSSASEALLKLEEGHLDAVLIGRRANRNEYGPNEVILKEGYTLVAEGGGVIYVEDLGQLEVHTYPTNSGLEKIFPDLNLYYHETVEEAVNHGDFILVKWTDWSDDLGLVVPIYEDGNKDSRFRTPILYSN